MNTSEDEPLSGLNGRLRPRKSNAHSPQSKPTKKLEGKPAQDKPKRTSTPSKTLLNKPDDLATKSDPALAPNLLCPYCDRKFASKQAASKHARRIHFSNSKQDPFSCLFCNHNEAEANDIIGHMVDSHPNQYFACLDCHTRFPSTSDLAEHKLNVCERQKPYRSKLRQKLSGTKKTAKRLESEGREFQIEKDFSSNHGFNGIVISCELKPSVVHDEADIEDNITTNLILPPSSNTAVIEKNAVIVLDDIQWNKRIPSNFSFHNTDADQILSRLGVVHRSPRTGESTRRQWIKLTDDLNQKFEKCFDTSFYSKVASNVQENLAKCLDGSFNFNPDYDNTIKTRKAKNSVVINTVEGFPILLAAEQYSRNIFDSYMPRGIAPKHKWKWDSLDNDKHFLDPDQIKRDSHANNCIITLVSSLDIWTQLCMRRKYEDRFCGTLVEKKTEKQSVIDEELKEILESREIPSSSSQLVKYTKKCSPVVETGGFPSMLGLRPCAAVGTVQPAVLSGEWVRPRCYVCCACGAHTRDARALSAHMAARHPNAHVHHYEIVGEALLTADISKHLYVPPAQLANRTRPLRGIRDCTKCKKAISLEELHQHMLDCAGDTPAVRRKCRYRPFGVRRRRSRLPDNTIRRKIRKDLRNRHKQKVHIRSRPKIRSEVGDAETIRKMIADLPAKRHRVLVNPMNPNSRTRKSLEKQRKLILNRRTSDDFKNRKLRAIKEQTLSLDPKPNQDEQNLTNPNRNDDDKPLRRKIQRFNEKTIRRNEAIKRKTAINRAKRKIQLKATRETKLAELTEENVGGTLPQQGEVPPEGSPEKLDASDADMSGRKHAGGRGWRGRGLEQRAPERPDRAGARDRDPNRNNDNDPPARAVPLKHSIASLTATTETRDKSVQFHHTFLVQQECNSTTQHAPTGPLFMFENEAGVSRLDKPPLPCNQKVPINPKTPPGSQSGQNTQNLAASKLNKPRKGLNACIAMLKNKLVEPEPSAETPPVTSLTAATTSDALPATTAPTPPKLSPTQTRPLPSTHSVEMSTQCEPEVSVADSAPMYFLSGPTVDTQLDPKPAEVFSRSVIPREHVMNLNLSANVMHSPEQISPQYAVIRDKSVTIPKENYTVTNTKGKKSSNTKQDTQPVKRKSTRLRSQAKNDAQKLFAALPPQIEVIPRKSSGRHAKATNYPRSKVPVTTAKEMPKRTNRNETTTNQLDIYQDASPRKIEYHNKYDMSGGRLIEQKFFRQSATTESRSLRKHRLRSDSHITMSSQPAYPDQAAVEKHYISYGERAQIQYQAHNMQYPEPRQLLPEHSNISVQIAPEPTTYAENIGYSDQIVYQEHRVYPDQVVYTEKRPTIADHNMYSDLRVIPDARALAEQRAYAEQVMYSEQTSQRQADQRAYQDQIAYAEHVALANQRAYHDQIVLLEQRPYIEHRSEKRSPTGPRSFTDTQALTEMASDQSSASNRRSSREHTLSVDRRPSNDRWSPNDDRLVKDAEQTNERYVESPQHMFTDRRQNGKNTANESYSRDLRRSFEQSATTGHVTEQIIQEQQTFIEHKVDRSQSNASSQPRIDRILTKDPYLSSEPRSSAEQISPRDRHQYIDQRQMEQHHAIDARACASISGERRSSMRLSDVRRSSELAMHDERERAALEEAAYAERNHDPYLDCHNPRQDERDRYVEDTSQNLVDVRGDHASRKLSQDVYLESHYGDSDARTSLSHQNVEPILSSPLDLSGKSMHIDCSEPAPKRNEPLQAPSYEMFETLDLSHKNSDSQLYATSDNNEDDNMVVDLRVKSSQLMYQEDTMDLSAQSPLPDENATDLSYKMCDDDTLPTDLSVRTSTRNEFIETDERNDNVHDLSAKMNIKLPEVHNEDVVADAPTDLSGKKNIKVTDVLPPVQLKVEAVCASIDLTEEDDVLIDENAPIEKKPKTKEYNFESDATNKTSVTETKLAVMSSAGYRAENSTASINKLGNFVIPQIKIIDTDANESQSKVDKEPKEQSSPVITGVPVAAANKPLPELYTSVNPPATTQDFSFNLNAPQVTTIVRSMPVYTLPNPVMSTLVNKHESTVPVYTLANACISVTKIESPNSASLTNTLLSIAGTTIANTTSVYTLAGTTIGTPVNYRGLPPNAYSCENAQNILNQPKDAILAGFDKHRPDVNASTATGSTLNVDQDPETARKIALLPKELVDILGNMPADHRNQLLNVLPQYVSTPSASSAQSEKEMQNVMDPSLTNQREFSSDLRSMEQYRSMNLPPNYLQTSNMPLFPAPYLSSSDMRHSMPYLLAPPPPPPPLPPPTLPSMSEAMTHQLNSRDNKTTLPGKFSQMLRQPAPPPLPPNTPPPLPVVVKEQDDEEDIKPRLTAIKTEKETRQEDYSAGNSSRFSVSRSTNNSDNNVVDLTEDRNSPISDVDKSTDDVTPPIVQEEQEMPDEVNVSKVVEKKANDKTSSLRAIRIKTPSERKKSHSSENKTHKVNAGQKPAVLTEKSVEFSNTIKTSTVSAENSKISKTTVQTDKIVITETVTETKSILLDLALNDEGDLSDEKLALVIQQAEVSSTQHNKKSTEPCKSPVVTVATVLEEVAKINDTRSAKSSTISEKEIKSDANKSLNDKCATKELVGEENKLVETVTKEMSRSENTNNLESPNEDSSTLQSNDSIQNISTRSVEDISVVKPVDISKKIQIETKTFERKEVSDEDSEDDVSLAVIVRQKRDQLNVTEAENQSPNTSITNNVSCAKPKKKKRNDAKVLKHSGTETEKIDPSLNDAVANLKDLDNKVNIKTKQKKIDRKKSNKKLSNDSFAKNIESNRKNVNAHVEPIKKITTENETSELKENTSNLTENKVVDPDLSQHTHADKVKETCSLAIEVSIPSNKIKKSPQNKQNKKTSKKIGKSKRKTISVKSDKNNIHCFDQIENTKPNDPKIDENTRLDNNPENSLSPKLAKDVESSEKNIGEHKTDAPKLQSDNINKNNVSNETGEVALSTSDKDRNYMDDLELKNDKITPLRRSSRGKSLYLETTVTEQIENIPETDTPVAEHKTPLTKKQLIFSKLLLDEENHSGPVAHSTPVKNFSVEDANIVNENDNASDLRPLTTVSPELEKPRAIKRKKSLQTKRKGKKKRSNSGNLEAEKVLPPSTDDETKSEIPTEPNVSLFKNFETLKSRGTVDCSTQERTSVDIEHDPDSKGHSPLAEHSSEKSTEPHSPNTSTEKRKLNLFEEIRNPKPKKIKSINLNVTEDKNIAEEKPKEKATLTSKVKTTCYMPTAARKIRSKSVFDKSPVDSYDPYDIDLDDMIVKSESIYRKKPGRKMTFSNEIDKTYRAPKPRKRAETYYDIHDEDSQMASCSRDCASESDDSSKSDVPLKKYVEDKEKKLLQGASNCKELCGRKCIKDKKGRRTLGAFNKVENCADPTETEEQLRSEQFMESFGFFSERKPRKSNLLATKKISETFHNIGNESEDMKYGRKDRKNKRSSQNENRKALDEEARLHYLAGRKMLKRGRRNKNRIMKPLPSFCDICKKEFRRADNYLRHQMSLNHVSKLSEIELKVKLIPTNEEPNYLLLYKQHLDRIKVITEEYENEKQISKNAVKPKLPTLREILIEVNKTIRDQELTERGLSRDEALFLDCCELLKSHSNDLNKDNIMLNPEASTVYVCRAETVVKEFDLLEKPTKGDGDVDSITARNILDSEEVRNLEKDLISGLQEAANSSSYKKAPLQRSVSDVGLDRTEEVIASYTSSQVPEPEYIPPVETEPPPQDVTPNKPKKQPEFKEKMYPDIIEPIDMFEDKFDKIKRKCRSQAAAAKQTPAVIEPSASHRPRKKSDKKKTKKGSKNNHQSSQVLTKGALKGFDGIKVSIPTSDINMSAIVPPIESSPRKKKKSSSKKKREKRDSASSSRSEGDARAHDSSGPPKKVDVYEFMDNEEAELFEFRPSTLMERFKNIKDYKDVPSTSKSQPTADDSNESGSDGDDFVYMSDDYVCSDDETETSLMSYELATKLAADAAKKTLPLKRKDAVDKNAVMGKIFKHNAVRPEKKSTKGKEIVKPKANLDQLFDSLLEDEPNSSMLNNNGDSSEKIEFASPMKYDRYNRTPSSGDEFSSPTKFGPPSPKRSPTPPREPGELPIIDYGPSTSKQYNPYPPTVDYGPSTSKAHDFTPTKEFRASPPKRPAPPKHRSTSEDDREDSAALSDDNASRTRASPQPKSSKDFSPGPKVDEGIGTSYDYSVEAGEDTPDLGVARQRARRKCTVGKQNVLAETWSSESEPDALPPRPTSAQSVVGPSRRKKGRKREGTQTTSRRNGRHLSFKKQETETRTREVRREEEDRSESPQPGPSVAGPGASARPRARAPAAGAPDPEAPELGPRQHGWIVGDSHKKLVTMLAHAKGRKRNNEPDDDKGLLE